MDVAIWLPIVVGLLIYLVPTLFVGGLIAGVTIGTGPNENTKRELKSGHRKLILVAIGAAVVLHVVMRVIASMIGT